MRLEHLKYMIEIDKLHSITAAAKSLYISQTTLSSIVKGVEAELGFTIFERTPSGVVTTPDGEEFLALAWEINIKFEEVKRLNQTKKNTDPVSVITSPSISSGLAGPVSKLMLEQEPFANLVFSDCTGSQVGAKIIQNAANIGLTYYMPDQLEEYRLTAGKYDIQVKKVFIDHLYLLVRTDHPLAGRDTVNVSEIHGENMAMLSHFRTNVNNALVPRNLRENNRTTTFTNVPLIKKAVSSYNMVSILSGYAIHYGQNPENASYRAVLLDTPDENKMSLCLIHHGNRSLGYLEKVMLGCICDYFSLLLPPPFSPEAKRLAKL